jgi:hypothetical protein
LTTTSTTTTKHIPQDWAFTGYTQVWWNNRSHGFPDDFLAAKKTERGQKALKLGSLSNFQFSQVAHCKIFNRLRFNCTTPQLTALCTTSESHSWRSLWRSKWNCSVVCE